MAYGRAAQASIETEDGRRIAGCQRGSGRVVDVRPVRTIQAAAASASPYIVECRRSGRPAPYSSYCSSASATLAARRSSGGRRSTVGLLQLLHAAFAEVVAYLLRGRMSLQVQGPCWVPRPIRPERRSPRRCPDARPHRRSAPRPVTAARSGPPVRAGPTAPWDPTHTRERPR